MGKNNEEQITIDRLIKAAIKSEDIIEVLDTNPNPPHGWANLVFTDNEGVLVLAQVAINAPSATDEERKAAEADACAWLASHPDVVELPVRFDRFNYKPTADGSAFLERRKNVDFSADATIESLRKQNAELEKKVQELEQKLADKEKAPEVHRCSDYVICPACEKEYRAGTERCQCGESLDSFEVALVHETVYREKYRVNIPRSVPDDEQRDCATRTVALLQLDPDLTEFWENNWDNDFLES